MVLLVIIRILLGGIFLISAASKIISPKLFVYNVKQYDILPPSIATMLLGSSINNRDAYIFFNCASDCYCSAPESIL